MITKQTFWSIVVYYTMTILLLTACSAITTTPHINVVEQAGLIHTVKIEILELDLEPTSTTIDQYVHRLTITNPQVIDQIVAALDMDLQLGPRARCPAQYRLHFHMDDGTMEPLGYACNSENLSFLRGEQNFWQGQDVMPPTQFNEFIQEQVALTG